MTNVKFPKNQFLKKSETRKMAQQLRKLSTLSGHLSGTPSTHRKQLTVVYKYRARESTQFFGTALSEKKIHTPITLIKRMIK